MQVSGHGTRMSTNMSRDISARSSLVPSRTWRTRGQLQRSRRASSLMSWESTCSWKLRQRWMRVSRRPFLLWQGSSIPLSHPTVENLENTTNDSGISRHAWVTGGQKMQQLEDLHLVLWDSTNLQCRHNRDVVDHENRELCSSQIVFWLVSLHIFFFFGFRFSSLSIAPLHGAMYMRFTDALSSLCRFLN